MYLSVHGPAPKCADTRRNSFDTELSSVAAETSGVVQFACSPDVNRFTGAMHCFNYDTIRGNAENPTIRY